MSNNALVADYLQRLLASWLALEDEKVVLQNAAGRLTEIAAEQSALVSSAQEALDRYNALNGTSYTLAQVRDRFFPTPVAEQP